MLGTSKKRKPRGLKTEAGLVWWFTPIIPATQKAVGKRTVVLG
jgi:hypothetical protein